MESLNYLRKNEICFFGAWVLFFISLLIESTEFFLMHNFGMVTKGMRYLSYLICIYIIINEQNVKKKNFRAFIFILAIFGISCLASTNKTMLLYLLILFAAFNINDKKIIRTTIWLQGLFLLLIVGLSQTGILHDYIFGVGTDRVRHGLGFTFALLPSTLFFYFCLGYIYYKKEKFKWKDAIILEFITIYFYIMTDSRMVFFLGTFFLLFFTIQGSNSHRWKQLSKINGFYLIIPAILCVFSFIVAFYYSPNNFLSGFNRLLSGRLALAQNAINKYGITLFGQHIRWVGLSPDSPTMGQDYNFVDSSYVQLGLEYGLVFIGLIIGLYTYGLKKAIDRRDYYFVFVVIFNLILSFSEPRLMNFAFNPFPVIIFAQMGRDVKKRVKVIKVQKIRKITPTQEAVNSNA